MQAIVVYAPDDYRLEEVEVPRARSDNIIEVEACRICASDIKTFHGTQSLWGGSGQPSWVKVPMNSWSMPWKSARTSPKKVKPYLKSTICLFFKLV
ncbi:hypothetical protein [Deinococcus marmoris]|uniref:hypothetical protein n=1 Tax=Deinococcus marmoris TaxID=249408 RepID=UPI0011150E9C|nr:hypothetical protein [Deinococcus marmoris]